MWDIPNGGYLMSTAAQVFADALSHPDPLTITGHYADESWAGSADVVLDIIRQGNAVSTAAVKSMQDGVGKVRFTATLGELGKLKVTTWVGELPPLNRE